MNLPSYRTLLLVTLAASAALCAVGCNGDGPQSVSSPMKKALTVAPLAWADEFDGASLDMTKWNVETGYGGNGWGNDEWQLYTADPANLRVENGELIITARANGVPGKRDGSITSGRITTENKLNIRFGRIEARIKVTESNATWPAFWALGGNFRSVGWPRCGEIDIMEVLNRFSDGFTTHSTVHWWNEAKNPPNANPPLLWDFVGESRTFDQPLSDNYHVYSAERTAKNIIFRIDGVTVYVRPLDATMSELADEFFLLLNVAIGGTHGADPTPANFSTPQEMRVDYVHIYAEPGEWRDPPDPSLTHKGIYSETHTNPMLPPTGVINTIDWSADWAASDLESTAIPPKEGVVSMSVDYQDSGAWGGGPVLVFDGGDFTQFAGLATYNTLVFSIDTSELPGFSDIGVEIQDPQGQSGTAGLRLMNYRGEVDGDWRTYSIPLADFNAANPVADLTNVVYLMFLTPVDASGAKISGDFYLDNIHLADYSTSERGIFSEQYMNPAFESRAFSTEEWSSSPSAVKTQSTEVVPFEGSYVLTVDYGGSGDGAWGGVGFEFADVDFTKFSSLATYNALVFSLNTAGFAAFNDLTVEIQDSGLVGSQVSLASYTPIDNGDWKTYEIPLADFGASDLTKVKHLLFVSPVDGNGDAVAGKYHVDDVHLTKRTFAPPPPPGNAGIYTETYSNPLLQSTITTNAILGWGGSGSTLTVDSTAVSPVEGTYVLTYDHFADGDKWGGVVFEFPIIDFTGGGMYDRLVFSLNTAGFSGFDDLQVELQDDEGTGAPLMLSKYTPQISGDWHTYEIPFTDFSAAQTAFDIDKVLRLLFFNPVDADDVLVPGTFHLDHIYLAKVAPTPPPPGPAGRAGIYSETNTNPMLTNTVTTNAILGWGGSGSTLTVDSTAVSPFEGTYVLTYDHFADGDKWGGVVFEFANIDFTDGGNYDRLVFSLNTAGFNGFDDLQVELQDDEGTGAPLMLSKYTPQISGDWHTYEIPFTDFSAAQTAFDIDKVLRLLFFNPVDASDALVPGTFHLDNIYLDSPPATDPTGIFSETYTNPMLTSTVTTNAILGWGGSGSTLTVPSTAVSAIEGTNVLTYDHFADGDKWGGVVFEFAVVDFTAGGSYDRLVFSLNTAGFSGFADLQVELQDDENTGAPLLLSKYTPQVSGDWHTYEIPLTDFSAAQTAFDIDKVGRLLFFNPADSTGALIPGVLHLDHIYIK